VRVCPTKTEANRVYLAFSGGRQGFSWSWIKGRTRDETDLPRRFRSVPNLYVRGITASMAGNIQPRAYVCIGFRDHIVHRMEFDDHAVRQKTWNDTDANGENQTEGSPLNGRNLRSTVDPVGSIRLILSTSSRSGLAVIGGKPVAPARCAAEPRAG